jgi:CHAD domain-containing protein
MEIEAKFVIPDETIYRRLLDANELAGLSLEHGPTVDVHDQYVDTEDGKLLAAGYACRLRAEGGGFLLTLKSTGQARDAIHRRDEREAILPAFDLDPERWPEGPARELAAGLAAGAPLRPLLEVHQTRARRNVRDGERVIGEMTVDAVATDGGRPAGPERYHELEIELKGDGTEDDLARLAAELQDSWHLPPQRSSKFERALATLRQGAPATIGYDPQGAVPGEEPPEGKGHARARKRRDRTPAGGASAGLAPDQLALLQRYVAGKSRPAARKAAVVLASAAGRSLREIAADTGMSTGRVRYWVQAFGTQGLAIFHKPPLERGPRGGAALAAAIGDQDGGRGSEVSPAPGAGESVGEGASGETLSLQDAMPARAGQGSSGGEGEPAGDGGGESTLPGHDAPPARGVGASIEGAARDGFTGVAAPAAEPGPPTELRPPQHGGPTPQAEAPAADAGPAIRPDDPMSEAGRALMYHQLQRMCEKEPGTRAGGDDEALHDMRVATRRLRAAYELFSPYFEPKALKNFRSGLRRTAHSLGAVRDLDVLLEKARKYEAGEGSHRPHQMAPLLDAWNARWQTAHEEMLAYLDSDRYRRFKDAFASFLTTPCAGALPVHKDEPIPYQVRHVAPRLLHTFYENVRAYEPVLPDAPLATYHQLRIACKKLRYGLEFFHDILGPHSPALVKRVTTMQDLLGELHDAMVAESLIVEFLAERVRRHPFEKREQSLGDVAGYLAAQWSAQHELLTRFPEMWAVLSGYEFRRGLSLTIAAI